MAQGPLSGFRDLLAEEMIPLQAMLDTIRRVYESYGFLPLKTPALERYETLAGKYGEEGEKLMYKFEDHGGRKVALRYDLTVPLARVVTQYGSQLPMPYKRYAVGEVWRGERPQAGRYREFLQFDADVVGSASPLADAEMVAMSFDAIAALGAEATVRVNHRLILDALAKKAGVSGKDARRFIAAIDKLDKIGAEQVAADIKQNFSDQAAELAGQYLAVDGEPQQRLAKVAELLGPAAKPGIDSLSVVFETLEAMGYSADKAVFDHTIARGLDYYTGIVYETVLKDAPEIGSVAAGGRYDNLIKALGGPDLPAVGTSVGVDRLFEGLKQLKAHKPAKTHARVLIVNFKMADGPKYAKVAAELRTAGVPTEVYYNETDLGKQVGYADKMGIPYVLLMGPDELAKDSALIKDLKSGDQKGVALDEIVGTLST